MECPHPVCCKIPRCKRLCERNGICISTGQFGFKFFERRRSYLMLIAAFCAFICFLLALVALVATSSNNEDIRHTGWTIGELERGGTIYFGLNRVLVSADNGKTDSFEWGDSKCSDLDNLTSEDDFCSECEDATNQAVPAVVINLLANIPSIITNIQRSTRRGDLNFLKNITVVVGIVGLFSSMAALSLYSDGCYHNLPNELLGQNVDYSLGAGFICAICSFVLKPIDILINVLTPVAPHDDELNEKLVIDQDTSPDIFDFNLG